MPVPLAVPVPPAMPVPPAIADHQTSLVRIVTGLFALLGLTGASLPGRVARHVHRAVAQVLRPAESATRRLIVFLACHMQATAKAKETPEHPPRPLPADLVRTGAGQSVPRFPLFDPRPQLLGRRRPPRRTGVAQPRMALFTDGAWRTLSLAPPPKPPDDGLTTAAHLARRLQALKAALDNLPRQARRLVRALTRRQKVPHLKLQAPLRPGRAPGFRQRARHEVDRIMHDSHTLARDAQFDTS